jgi:hypothetical protein
MNKDDVKGHVTCMGETRNPYSIFDGQLKETENFKDLDVNGRLTLN